jgi:CRISPR/Cas system-associated endoribonuclease Cas2
LISTPNGKGVSVTLYVITYDVRAKNPAYQSLYDQLNEWGAAHLQDSVWLAVAKCSKVSPFFHRITRFLALAGFSCAQIVRFVHMIDSF